MTRTTYEINVAYKGQHDFTVVVDRNGPHGTNIGNARFVKRAIKDALQYAEEYEVSMTEVHTAIERKATY
jgi:ribosomal protein S5